MNLFIIIYNVFLFALLKIKVLFQYHILHRFNICGEEIITMKKKSFDFFFFFFSSNFFFFYYKNFINLLNKYLYYILLYSINYI